MLIVILFLNFHNIEFTRFRIMDYLQLLGILQPIVLHGFIIDQNRRILIAVNTGNTVFYQLHLNFNPASFRWFDFRFPVIDRNVKQNRVCRNCFLHLFCQLFSGFFLHCLIFLILWQDLTDSEFCAIGDPGICFIFHSDFISISACGYYFGMEIHCVYHTINRKTVRLKLYFGCRHSRGCIKTFVLLFIRNNSLLVLNRLCIDILYFFCTFLCKMKYLALGSIKCVCVINGFYIKELNIYRYRSRRLNLFRNDF